MSIGIKHKPVNQSRRTWAQSTSSTTPNMADSQSVSVAETVRMYTVLYDKSSKDFKDKTKKDLVWQDVARKVGFPSGNSNKDNSKIIC